MREGLAQLLQSQAGFQIVGTAGNGRDAVKQVLELRPQVAIVDISMPVMSGFEVPFDVSINVT